MTNIERTMREEGWVITDELLLHGDTEPPEVTAFRAVQEQDWEHFLAQVTENPAMKFFSAEQQDFSHAPSWEALAEINNIKAFDEDWAIPDGLAPNVKRFCRELRWHVRQNGSDGLGGSKAFWTVEDAKKFYTPGGKDCLLVVMHDGGALAPYFNISYEDYQAFEQADLLLKARGMWRESINPAVSTIYPA